MSLSHVHAYSMQELSDFFPRDAVGQVSGFDPSECDVPAGIIESFPLIFCPRCEDDGFKGRVPSAIEEYGDDLKFIYSEGSMPRCALRP